MPGDLRRIVSNPFVMSRLQLRLDRATCVYRARTEFPMRLLALALPFALLARAATPAGARTVRLVQAHRSGGISEVLADVWRNEAFRYRSGATTTFHRPIVSSSYAGIPNAGVALRII